MRGASALVAGGALFWWGYEGGSGPFAMGPGFVQILGFIAALYGLSVLVASFWTAQRLRLSSAERQRWGPTLEPRRDELLERMASGEGARNIADRIEGDLGVPRDVTLRFLIEIGRAASGGGGRF